jgi:hypothetical protein
MHSVFDILEYSNYMERLWCDVGTEQNFKSSQRAFSDRAAAGRLCRSLAYSAFTKKLIEQGNEKQANS